MAITYASIAKASGVSTTAVSLVMRNPEHPGFPLRTRTRILDTAKRLNYRPNRIAASLRGGRTKTLALILPYNQVEMMDVAERAASKLGYSILIQLAPKPDLELERQAVQTAIEHRVDGLIWQPSQPTLAYRDLLAQLKEFQREVVFVAHRLRGLPRADWVFTDIEPGLRAGVELLRQGGSRRFVYVCPDDFHVMRRWRLQIFRRLVGEPFDVVSYPRDGCPRQLLSERLRGLLRLGHPLSIVTDLEWAAVHLVDICREQEVRIPEQVSLVSLGDSLIGGSFRIGEVTTPKITSVRRAMGEAGGLAVSMLVDRIEGTRTGPGAVQALPTKLIVRGSTSPAGLPVPANRSGIPTSNI